MTAPRSDRFAPSPVFGLIVVATLALGATLWRGNDLGGIGVFAFVLVGWVLSLTLHEFGHAVVAFAGGDHTVADKGYLTLDVRRYTDPGMSLLFPVLILAIGGIGFPGGAVWINVGLLRSRWWRSAVSAAGPAATLACGLACLVPIRFGWFDPAARPLFAVALGFLGALQVIALVLNLIPVPGFDGFGIVEPHLSQPTLARLAPVRQWGFMLFLAALWVVPPVAEAFWGATDWLSEVLGGDSIRGLRAAGWREFRFWE